MVVSGVPERIKSHGERVADMALAMLSEVTGITEPANSEDHLKIRIGKRSFNMNKRPDSYITLHLCN